MSWTAYWEGFGWTPEQNIAILIMAAVVTLAFFAFHMAKSYFARHKDDKSRNTAFLHHLFRRITGPVQFLFVVSVIVAIVTSLFPELTEEDWVQKFYSMGIIIVLAWMIIKAIGLTADWMLTRYSIGMKDNLKARRIHTQVRVVRRLAVSLTVLIALACCLMVFDQIRSLGVSLIASAGLAGVIIGLAAQKTLGNFFTGLQIAITQPIRIEDAVVVEGEWGWIEEINLTYVVVKIWDQRRLILPISYFVDKPFQNWTRTSADILAPVTLFVDYTMPVAAMREALDRIMEEEAVAALWDKKVKVLQVVDATEKTMNIRILVSAWDSPTAWDLRCAVRERMIAYIQESHPDSLPRLRGEAAINRIDADVSGAPKG